MRIDNTNGTIRPATDNPLPGSLPLREGELAAPASTKPLAVFAPTSDLSKLLQQLRDLPEIRQDVVYDVKFRILSGELDGPDASTEAAEQIAS
jgi:hypothetical protein